MLKILLAITFIFMFAASDFAQGKKNSPKANASKQKADTVQFSGLSRNASKLEEASPGWACGGIKTYTGTVIKRDFDENEVMLSGFVIRQATDVRLFVNIDAERVADLDGLLPSKLSLILGKGKKVKIWAIMCENGNSESLNKSLFLNKVQAL